MSEVKVSEKGIEYAAPGVLKRKQRVFSQALLMKIPHSHEGISDISLKIGERAPLTERLYRGIIS